MSNGPRRISWRQFCEARDAEAALVIDNDDPKVPPFVVPPAERWVEAFSAAEGSDARGVAVLGVKEWERWKKLGRNLAELDAIFTNAERLTAGE